MFVFRCIFKKKDVKSIHKLQLFLFTMHEIHRNVRVNMSLFAFGLPIEKKIKIKEL